MYLESYRVNLLYVFQSPPRGNVIAYNPHKVAQNSLLAGLQENLGLGDVSFLY